MLAVALAYQVAKENRVEQVRARCRAKRYSLHPPFLDIWKGVRVKGYITVPKKPQCVPVLRSHADLEECFLNVGDERNWVQAKTQQNAYHVADEPWPFL